MAVDDRRREDRRALQVAAWRGDADVAVLNPTPGHAPPEPEVVHLALEELRSVSCRAVITGALHKHELRPFLANGFVPRERLHLLTHRLLDLPVPTRGVKLRRARWRDRDDVLTVDHRSFDEFWVLDRSGLDDAVRATPTSRFRVSGRSRQITGYAVTGRSGHTGYLQRLAVDPRAQRQGLGTTLVVDSLRWLARTGASTALVNTQERNAAALELYRSCGFELQPNGLTVLTLDLTLGPDDARDPGR